MEKMTYEACLEWIHSKLKFGSKPGLERISWLLQELGNPQEKVKAVHIVGTNGKGSTVNYLQKIFSGAGYEVGTFVSPYIMDFRERISTNGQPLEKEAFVKLVHRLYPIVERLPLETEWTPATEFEIITAMMFLYFGEIHPVDIAFIEAGLGGLYDSTNVFSPLAVICPSIGLDHQAILGDSYEEIALQKAGVLKNNSPFIYAVDRTDVRRIFEDRAAEVGAPTFELGKDFSYENQGEQFQFSYQDRTLSHLTVTMPGQHQRSNASLAIMATELLRKDYPAVTDESLQKALSDSQWLGRTEFLTPNLMIDGAHNKESVAVLQKVLKTQYPNRAIHILFAAIDTKPVDEMLQLLGEFSSLSVTTFDYPNSFPLQAYPPSIHRVASWKEWLENTYQESEEVLYIVTGSLYFISQIRQYWFETRESKNYQ